MSAASRASVLLVLAVVCSAGAARAGDRPRIGAHPAEACQTANGCNYFLAKGPCAFASDGGGNDLLAVLNGKPVKLKFRERRPVLLKTPGRPVAVGNRFVARYDSVDSPDGAVQIQILDTVVQPIGACEPGAEGCKVTHYQSHVRIFAPRGSVDFHGSGVCRPPRKD